MRGRLNCTNLSVRRREGPASLLPHHPWLPGLCVHQYGGGVEEEQASGVASLPPVRQALVLYPLPLLPTLQSDFPELRFLACMVEMAYHTALDIVTEVK